MDLTKVNPILGYKMYSSQDRALIAQRSAYGINIPVRRTYKSNGDV